jgi:hypothetical protein
MQKREACNILEDLHEAAEAQQSKQGRNHLGETCKLALCDIDAL